VRAAQEVLADMGPHPEWRERFKFVWERHLLRGAVKVGDRIHIPEQAAALRLIARDGAAAFYEGPIADAIVRAVEADGGLLTRDDLRGYRVAEINPLEFEAFGRRFVTMPPPSSGGVTMAQTLGLLERGWHPEPDSDFIIPDHFPLRDIQLRPGSRSDTVAAMPCSSSASSSRSPIGPRGWVTPTSFPFPSIACSRMSTWTSARR
jgi:hypothetical protein